MAFPAVWAAAMVDTHANGTAASVIAIAAAIGIFARWRRRIFGHLPSIIGAGLAQRHRRFHPLTGVNPPDWTWNASMGGHIFVYGRNQDMHDEALILDFLFVDFRTGFVDHDHASTLVAVVKVNGDLTGDQVGGFPGVVLVLAIQSNRIFEPDAVSDVEMKNGHWLLLEVNAVKPSVFQDAVRRHQA
jgi:hypothetical protein